MRRLRTLMLRGGSDVDESDLMRAASESEEITWVSLEIVNTCSGRSESLAITADIETRIADLKRSLRANYSSSVCDPDRMELWWHNRELTSHGDENLGVFGVGVTGSKVRLVLKERASTDRMVSGPRGGVLNQDFQYGDGYGEVGGWDSEQGTAQADATKAIMQDPVMMKQYIESNPQLQEQLKQNPELRRIMNDPESFRRLLQAVNDPSKMRTMLQQHDNSMRNVMSTPGGRSALRRTQAQGGVDLAAKAPSGMSSGSSTIDPAVEHVAGLSGAAFTEALETLDASRRSQAFLLHEELFRRQHGWNRDVFKSRLAENQTLALEYGQLLRRFGSVDCVRGNLSASEELQTRHPNLACALQCLPSWYPLPALTQTPAAIPRTCARARSRTARALMHRQSPLVPCLLPPGADHAQHADISASSCVLACRRQSVPVEQSASYMGAAAAVESGAGEGRGVDVYTSMHEQMCMHKYVWRGAGETSMHGGQTQPSASTLNPQP